MEEKAEKLEDNNYSQDICAATYLEYNHLSGKAEEWQVKYHHEKLKTR